MNAIEQMMQAFSANSAQSMAALFGPSASGTSATGFAEQFAAAMQGSVSSSPFAQAVADGNISIYAVTGADTAAAATDLVSQQFQQQLSDTPTVNTEITTAAANTSDDPQLVKITPENFATLLGLQEANNGQASISDTAQVSEAQFFVVQTPGADAQGEVHILPVAELEALFAAHTLTAETGTTVSTATPATPQAATVQTTTATPTPAPTGPGTNIPLDGNIEGNSEAIDPKLVASQQAKPETAVEQTASKTLSERAGETTAAKLVKEQPIATDAKAQKVTEGEAQAVQTQQAAAKKATPNAQQNTTANTATSNQAAAGAAAAQSSTGNPSGNQSGEQKQSKPDDGRATQQVAKKAASAAPTAAQPTMPSTVSSWTPERVSGFGEGFTPETYSAGLSGLRGESSFMAGMGLLGGKASPNMGGQIAKQVNLQITNAVKNGNNEFTMRLDPAELGRVQVKMKFLADGKVAAQVMAERPETLELLQREVKGLERAVEAGGHKMEGNGISFSLDTGNGESAGKAFAEAMQQDRLQEQIEGNAAENGENSQEDASTAMEETDLAMLEEILSRVTPETGLDVRI